MSFYFKLHTGSVDFFLLLETLICTTFYRYSLVEKSFSMNYNYGMFLHRNFKLAAIQMKPGISIDENIEHAVCKIREAASGGTDVVILPEMFCCPYSACNFPKYAQEEKGAAWHRLSECAKENGIYLAAGTMPELAYINRRKVIFNTAYVFDRNGNQIAKHRKMHLFNCDYKGGQFFHESDTLTAGSGVTVFETEFGKFGLMICFDIRFPELCRLMTLQGAEFVIVPASFNMTSGPRWWDLMFRSRSVDNQIFMAGCSAARDEGGSYIAWGHSLVTNPFGEILAQLDEKEGILRTSIDLEQIEDMRQQSPILKSIRHDIYSTELKNEQY